MRRCCYSTFFLDDHGSLSRWTPHYRTPPQRHESTSRLRACESHYERLSEAVFDAPCSNCRKRKIKCDAARPTCSHCILFDQDCIYNSEIDKRKIPTKHRITALEQHVRTLERQLSQNGLALPERPAETCLPPREDEEIRLHHDTAPSSSRAAIPTDSKPLGSTELTSSLMEQLAGNLGSLRIADDGQLRFFGATSNLHILAARAHYKPVLNIQNTTATLRAADLDHEVDVELEDHLIKLYFCWEDPSIHVVDETAFYRERARCRARDATHLSPLYSEVLLNAICAVGAALTPRQQTNLPEPLVEFFNSRARALLEAEMDSPTLSTVQALVILSGVEAVLTRDARGWLYSGMAVRLATDLGLHLDAQPYVAAGVIDAEEATLRSTIFWGTFIHERMWSLYMGRPISLSDQAISLVSTPASNPAWSFWQPYVDGPEDSMFPALQDPIKELQYYIATLCAKMTIIRETLYSDSPVFGTRREDLVHFAADMNTELARWLASLPDSLTVDLGSLAALYVPHVLQLHMQYYCVVILVNRPFFAQSTNDQSSSSSGTPAIGRSSCTAASTSMTRLLQLYRRLYGFRRINIQAVHLIFTAALIHVCNACLDTAATSSAAWKDLEVCTQALMEMGQGYKNAIRALEVISHIKVEMLASVNRKKRPSDKSIDDQDSSQKRHRSAVFSPLDQDSYHLVNGIATDPFDDDGTFSLDALFWSELTSLNIPG